MNWLQKIADKSEFLFNKYLQFFMQNCVNFLFWSGQEHLGLSLGKDKRDSVLQNLLRTLIYQAITWNKKYAEWYVYQSILNPTEHFGTHRKFAELNDYLLRGHGSIPSLKTTFEEAYALSDAWHEEIRAKAAQYKTNNVIAQLSDGFTLVSVPSEDLKAEGYHMGHCVGGYCEEVKSGQSLIFSIRDPQNRPHATIEMKEHIKTKYSMGEATGAMDITQIKGKENKAQPKYSQYVEEAIDALMQHYKITFDRYSWEDYQGFQPEEDLQRERLEKLNEQHDLHTFTKFKDHRLARHGPTDKNIESWIKSPSGGRFIQTLLNNNSIFQKFVGYFVSKKYGNDPVAFGNAFDLVVHKGRSMYNKIESFLNQLNQNPLNANWDMFDTSIIEKIQRSAKTEVMVSWTAKESVAEAFVLEYYREQLEKAYYKDTVTDRDSFDKLREYYTQKKQNQDRSQEVTNQPEEQPILQEQMV
jgi:hypothetical protein